jgi:CBS domain-containing protein
LKVKDLMSTNLSKVDIDTSITDIARTMKEKNIGSVPVCKGNQVVGILTDRDIVLRDIAMGGNSMTTKAKDIMTAQVSSTNPNMDIHEAAKIMSDKQIRRLPVIDNGNLVGMLALGDIAIRTKLEDNAGVALGDISEPTHTIY